MRILHTADLHIGFRQFDRLMPDGVNAREADVADTFKRLVAAAIALEPDAVVVAGDVFHHPKPSNHATLVALEEFGRLALALNGAPIIVIAGNHDHGLTEGFRCILPMLSHLGVHVVVSHPTRLWFPNLGLSVLGVPDAPLMRRPELVPDPNAEFNVLLLHGEAVGVKQGRADSRPSIHEITPDELAASAWDYVALGHYHQHERIEANVSYAGSIDFTSSNPWQEIATPKGFIERDLQSGDETFHVLEASRPFIDLPAIQAEGMSVADVDLAVRDSMDAIEGGHADAVVRLTAIGVSRETRRALDHRALRMYRKSCLSFQFRADPPEIVVSASGWVSRAPGAKRVSLDEMVRRALSDATKRALGPDVDRDQLVALGAEYMAQTESPTPEPGVVTNAEDAAA
jgi:DNA repair protein SbcD/Mre11